MTRYVRSRQERGHRHYFAWPDDLPLPVDESFVETLVGPPGPPGDPGLIPQQPIPDLALAGGSVPKQLAQVEDKVNAILSALRAAGVISA